MRSVSRRHATAGSSISNQDACRATPSSPAANSASWSATPASVSANEPTRVSTCRSWSSTARSLPRWVSTIRRSDSTSRPSETTWPATAATPACPFGWSSGIEPDLLRHGRRIRDGPVHAVASRLPDVATAPRHPDGPHGHRRSPADDQDPPLRQLGDLRRREDRNQTEVLVDALAGELGPGVQVVRVAGAAVDENGAGVVEDRRRAFSPPPLFELRPGLDGDVDGDSAAA